MPDTVTKVTRNSFGENIAGSIAGAGIGIMLFIAAFPVLWHNEERALARFRTLDAGRKTVITVSADKLNTENDGKLVFLTGKAMTTGTLKDPTFGITANALKLERRVEMYQWKENKREETKEKFGGGSETVTTYTYTKVWSDQLISSSEFESAKDHQNPALKPYENSLYSAEKVTVGQFYLSSGLLEKLGNLKFYPVSEEFARHRPVSLSSEVKRVGEIYYQGSNPASPQIGDVRIKFFIIPNGPVSLAAKQVVQSFEPYAFPTGSIELIEPGTLSVYDLFQQAKDENNLWTWIWRGIGGLMMIFGLAMFFAPAVAIGNIIPLVGNIVGAGTGILAIFIGLACAIGTVAIAWLNNRPLIGIPLLIGAVIIFIFAISRKKAPRAKKRRSRTRRHREHADVEDFTSIQM